MSALKGISCVIITKNEEKNIVRCIESVISVADEIIVIDSFSTDATKDICRRYKTYFEQVEWKGYSEQKNYGNSLAKYEYILSIDADESLSDELIQEIIELKNKGFKADAYTMKRLTSYCGKWIRHCGWYPDRKLRLWKNERGTWKGYIHEKVIMDDYSTLDNLKSDILHFSYHSINDHIRQMILFTDLMAINNYNKGEKPGILKILFSPLIKFITSYFFQGGFKDGFYGLVICALSGSANFLKYAKTRQLFIQNKNHF